MTDPEGRDHEQPAVNPASRRRLASLAGTHAARGQNMRNPRLASYQSPVRNSLLYVCELPTFAETHVDYLAIRVV